jgi:hypothetical protein
MKCIQAGVFGILACAMTMSLSAQAPQPGAQAPTASSAESNKITVTGCLAKASGTPSPTGTTGSAASSKAADTKFVLNDVTPSASSTAGTAGAAGAASIASSYRLDGDDSKLTPHVGHKVEISGTVDRSSMSEKSAEPGAGAASAPSAPKLKVDNVKMIASSCTP